MIVPHMTLPEVIFLGLVLACFAAFGFTLAGVHLYTTLPPARRRKRPTAAARVAPAPLADQVVSA